MIDWEKDINSFKDWALFAIGFGAAAFLFVFGIGTGFIAVSYLAKAVLQ